MKGLEAQMWHTFKLRYNFVGVPHLIGETFVNRHSAHILAAISKLKSLYLRLKRWAIDKFVRLPLKQ